MCLDANWNDIKIAEKDFYVYKVVEKESGIINSFLNRKFISCWYHVSRKNYKIGKITESLFKYSKGLYCYKNPKHYKYTLKCLVPKGTRYVNGTGPFLDHINVERLIPIKLMSGNYENRNSLF